MTTSPDDALTEIRHTLERWHTTHPDASFAEMEEAVEAHLHRLRASLLAERVDGTIVRDHPTCRECGSQMEPRTQQDRRVVLGGDEVVEFHRSYSVCPACGSGLFPPG
jgi:YgiT-type zinc finger domain-containing protein